MFCCFERSSCSMRSIRLHGNFQVYDPLFLSLRKFIKISISILGHDVRWIAVFFSFWWSTHIGFPWLSMFHIPWTILSDFVLCKSIMESEVSLKLLFLPTELHHLRYIIRIGSSQVRHYCFVEVTKPFCPTFSR